MYVGRDPESFSHSCTAQNALVIKQILIVLTGFKLGAGYAVGNRQSIVLGNTAVSGRKKLSHQC